MIFTTDLPTPYTAVIFSSTRTSQGGHDGYSETAARMEKLASEQPGFLGIESARDPISGLGITVSYWKDEASAKAWKMIPSHLKAQNLGKEKWYSAYAVRIVTVTKAYDFQAGSS